MKFRNLLLSVGLTLGCSLAALPAWSVTPYPAGTVISGGLTWLKPDANARLLEDASAYCSGSSAGGITGWRLPTELELTNLYYEKGAVLTGEAGWTSNWLWTSTPWSNWYTVARMNDGVWSYTLDPSYTTCVHTTTVDSGSVSSGNLAFTKPDATVRTYAAAQAFCAASTANGVTGWRLPTELELSNLYYERGASYMSGQGWTTTGWIWTSNPYGSGHQVVRMSDGLWSYDTSGSQYVSCVREDNALATATLTSGGLSWITPSSTLQSWSDANNYCTNSTLAGATGWRLPTELELSNLYYERGQAFMLARGWSTDWIWTSDTYQTGHQVVRMLDGQWSYASSGNYGVTCVKSAPPATTLSTTVNNGGLTFSKPAAIPRPYHNTTGFCSSTTIAGQTGWRLPTATELTDLYTAQGSALTAVGWPTDWIWTSDTYLNGWKVVRLLDGTWSYAHDDTSLRYYVSCVKSTADLNSGTVSSGGKVWQAPPAILRPWGNTEGYCASQTIAGQNGWRMPSKAELSALYTDKGSTYLANAGWTMNWIWSLTPYSTGYNVVRMSDGVVSWANSADANRYGAACVRDSSGLPAGSVVSGGLTWARPPAIARPWNNSVNYCSSAVIAGTVGWRMPTAAELSALYSAQGSANMAALGWSSDWIWSSTPYSSGYNVVRMSDGTTSWASTADANRYGVACVK